MDKEFEHGKASSYNNYKCRCDLCRQAWADYMRDRVRRYRARKKAEKKPKGVSINL